MLCEPTYGWMVRRKTILQLTRVQVLDLALVFAFSWVHFMPFSDVYLMSGEVPVVYEGLCDDFVNL